MCALSVNPAKSFVALDRELDQEKILVAPQERRLVLYLWPLLEHVRNGRSVPGVPSPVDLDPVLSCTRWSPSEQGQTALAASPRLFSVEINAAVAILGATRNNSHTG